MNDKDKATFDAVVAAHHLLKPYWTNKKAMVRLEKDGLVEGNAAMAEKGEMPWRLTQAGLTLAGLDNIVTPTTPVIPTTPLTEGTTIVTETALVTPPAAPGSAARSNVLAPVRRRIALPTPARGGGGGTTGPKTQKYDVRSLGLPETVGADISYDSLFVALEGDVKKESKTVGSTVSSYNKQNKTLAEKAANASKGSAAYAVYATRSMKGEEYDPENADLKGKVGVAIIRVEDATVTWTDPAIAEAAAKAEAEAAAAAAAAAPQTPPAS